MRSLMLATELASYPTQCVGPKMGKQRRPWGRGPHSLSLWLGKSYLESDRPSQCPFQVGVPESGSFLLLARKDDVPGLVPLELLPKRPPPPTLPTQVLSTPPSGLFYKRGNMWAPKPDCLWNSSSAPPKCPELGQVT